MKGKLSLTNLLEFFEDVTSKVDNVDPIDVAYLDSQKAFVKGLHKRLIQKFRSQRVKHRALAWIEDWLTDRKQKIGMNGLPLDND
eukprot:g18956.t1